mmetsp:Transcript_32184/g.70119  ORF Transcript_32184/g.70119 Transcript_32184/m.70119 type:complete len:126 (+) Transcript_32184:1467-1844(+)
MVSNETPMKSSYRNSVLETGMRVMVKSKSSANLARGKFQVPKSTALAHIQSNLNQRSTTNSIQTKATVNTAELPAIEYKTEHKEKNLFKDNNITGTNTIMQFIKVENKFKQKENVKHKFAKESDK